MHEEILTPAQKKLLPLVKSFAKDFGLVGGTALALHLGHRRSIDFDLFTLRPFNALKVRQRIRKFHAIEKVLHDEKGEYTVMIGGVRFTFFHYPFPIMFSKRFGNIITLSDIPTLAAMKAYALGRRAKWKDYVDLYFIMKNFGGITPVIRRAHAIFKNDFNEKLFRVQLAYFKDIDYSEEVDYLPEFEVADAEIKHTLINFSTSDL